MELILQENLSEPSFAKNLVLDAMPVDDQTTPSVAADVYWRWDEDDTMEPQYLGSQAAGHTLRVPFTLVKDVRLFLVSRTQEGLRSVNDVKQAEQFVLSAPALVGAPPSGLNITDETTVGSDREIDLAWTNNGGTGDVIVEVRLKNFTQWEAWDTVATLSSSATTHTDTVLEPIGDDVDIQYRVSNESAIGYSNIVSTTWDGS